MVSEAGRPSVDDWRRELDGPLAEVFSKVPRVGGLSPLGPPKAVADDTMKSLVSGPRGEPLGVLLCSPPVAPNAVAHNMERTRRAQQALGPDLGRVILGPLLEGWAFGLSYALLPYCRPLSDSRWLGRAQQLGLGPSLFDWLRRATAATVSPRAEAIADGEIVSALECLAGFRGMPPPVLDVARRALDRLDAGAWVPRRVLMHGDLWWGNILIRPRGPADAPRRRWRDRFVIIDWPGSRPDGFAFFDLVRLAQSVRPTDRRLRAEVVAHCEAIGCDVSDARSYLATALGFIGLHLGYFPEQRYVLMAETCLKTLERVVS